MQRRMMLLFSCLMVAMPWLWVTFPPIADLPQQIAQLRLFTEALTDPQSPYLIQWTTPNRLVYVLVWLCWKLFPVSWVGGMTMMSLGLLWVLSHHMLARSFQIPSAAAVLTGLFVFNSSVYWGLLNFLCGWPVFILWFVWTVRVIPQDRIDKRDWLVCLLLSLLLFLAHALWFVAGLFWLGMMMLWYWRLWKTSLFRGTALLPALLWAVYWRISTMASSIYVHGGAAWDKMPWEKLQLHDLYTFGAGHLKSDLAMTVFGLSLAGLFLGALLYRKELWKPERRPFLLAGLFFLLLYLFFPRRYNNTVEFDRRWLSPALIFLTLGLPLWTPKRWLQWLWSSMLVLVFCIVTTMAWRDFDRNAVKGLPNALKQIKKGSRVMGLDFIKYHPRIGGRPFMHMVAYSQVYHGGNINFSFATFPTLLVQFKQVRRPPWGVGLEWRAERIFTRHQGQWMIRLHSLRYFDYILIHAKSRMHLMFARLKLLQPVTPVAPWRLYQVTTKHPDS